MNRRKLSIIITLSIIVVAVGVKVIVTKTPIKFDGPAWRSLEKCATHQKRLYRSIESYKEEHGQFPEAIEEFNIDGSPAERYWKCPASENGYDIFLENYGKPDAVIIADKQNKHSTTFMFWLRGLKPHVQTMGDGTIHLFKGGKITTMIGSKNKQ